MITFGSILAPFWLNSGPFLGSFWAPFWGPFRTQFWPLFGAVFGAILGGPSGPPLERKHKENKGFWSFSGALWVPFWGPFWGSFWVPFWAQKWLHFGPISGPLFGSILAHFGGFQGNLDFRAANPGIPFLFGLGPSPRPGG